MLKAEPPRLLMAALSLVCCAGRQELMGNRRLMAVAMSLGGSILLAGEGVAPVQYGEPECQLSCSQAARSTSISCGSWAGLPGAAAFQSGSSWKVNCKTSSSLFKPSGHTTTSLCCNSLHICSWWSWPWVSMLGIPSIMVLTCPLLDRDT